MKYFVILLAIIAIPLANAQEYKLKYIYYPKDMVIESGKTNETLVVLENLHNETVYEIKINFHLPQGFSANYTTIDEIEYKQKKPARLFIGTNAKNGTYNITIWAESIETVSGIKVQSPKYNFTVNVTGYINTTAISTTTSTSTTINIATQNQNIKTTPNVTTTIQKISSEERSKRIIFIIPAIIAVLVIGFIILSR